MAERRERTREEYFAQMGIPKDKDVDNGAWSKNIACKSCKFAHKLYGGKEIRLNTKQNPYYAAGKCEKYEIKPKSVYFDGAKCPKYEAE